MLTRTRIRMCVAVVCGLLGASVAAGAEEAISTDELLRELKNLRAEVAELRAAQNQSWMNERRAEEVKVLVREVLSDSQTRASLLDSTVIAGHNGKNFFLASEDGNFNMIIKGQIQARYIANFRDGQTDNSDTDDANGDNDEGEAGFVIRRAKIAFEGHVINPRVHYALQLAVDRDDNEVIADKIVIGYDLTDTLYLWAGEDKAPFLREELTSSSRQLAVERSLVNEAFTLDKVQGLGLNWAAHDRVKLAAMIHDGAHSGDAVGGSWTPWLGVDSLDEDFSGNKDFWDDPTDFAVAARADVLLAGEWNQWADFTSWPNESFFAYVGAAIDYEIGETGDVNGNRVNWTYLTWTVDGGIEYRGWSLYAAYVGATIESDDSASIDFGPWGLVVQGSYNIALNNGTSIEPFARYEHLDLDHLDTLLPSDRENEIDILTFGGNWYHAKHAAKLTADIVIALDPLHVDVPAVSDGLGLLFDEDGQDNQLALRLQYQLLF